LAFRVQMIKARATTAAASAKNCDAAPAVVVAAGVTVVELLLPPDVLPVLVIVLVPLTAVLTVVRLLPDDGDVLLPDAGTGAGTGTKPAVAHAVADEMATVLHTCEPSTHVTTPCSRSSHMLQLGLPTH